MHPRGCISYLAWSGTLNSNITLNRFLCAMLRLVTLMLLFTAFTAQAQQENTLIFNTLPESTAADSAFLALKDAYNKTTDKAEAARILRGMGQICYHLGHYPQALDYHLQAGKLFRETEQLQQLAENLNDIGILYYYSRQPQLARQQYNDALQLYHQLHNSAGVAVTYGKIGHLYEKQQHYDSAFYFQRSALAQYGQIDDRRGMAKIYENLGSIHEDLEHYDSAHFYFTQALALNKDSIARIEVLNNLGDILRKTGRYREGLEQSRFAMQLASRIDEQYQLCSAYRDMAKSFSLLGQPDSAYYYLELSREHLLDIYSRESSKQLALLQTMYDMEKKNHEIEKLQNARKTIVAIILVGILLVAVALLIISRQRLKIKNAELQHLREQEKARLQELDLKQELEVRSKELSAHTLHIIEKNQLLEELHNKLDALVRDDKRDQKKQLKQLQLQINQNFNHDQHWDEFRGIFEQVHESFFDKLKNYCDHLTAGDLRLVALIKMNLGSGDIATLLNISQDSLRVVRYRLRKKLNLPQGESLSVFIQSI